ncbi:BMP family lipoprotein [Chondromyces apiculatus]|uniref:Bmp family protein n=1 Tax=Chondromyces apiculatus DSM 436 TaxID=1192034 RepID=A0A017SY74_9BACT|nr:BMP family ABC transporter substrate-binding protein [Chondromyces apiculatus]EYF01722.1 bmp family protein [Chondromyces apiculatus DSM 436]
MSRRRFFVGAALSAVVALLAGCSSRKSDRPDCSKPEVFCVGLVTDVGKVDDKSFNQSAWEGALRAQKELGAVIQYIETTDAKDYAKNIGTFAEEHHDAVVTVGYALAEATQAAAVRYPDVKFIGVDQLQPAGAEKANLASLVFAEDKAGFLVGALAAMVTKSGKIGAVMATDAVPPVWRYGEGFRAGARHVKPEIEISLVYHSDVGIDRTFTDPEWGKTTALSMIDKGVDIVFGAGGKTGNGALLGAAEKGALAIGVDTDQYATVPEAQKVLLTSAMKRVDEGTFDLLKLAREGKMQGGNLQGKASYAPFHDQESKVPAEVKSRLEALEKGLMDGSIKTSVPPTKT